ncbi:hypothetical protein ACEWY4_011403 [Coilia grayii]|uniref:Aminopeptidase n=1 Tax=Coilia grayii TaxID=363190 RepID=A0ABD1K4N0_9TELE
MAAGIIVSKTLAAATVVMTLSAVGGIISMAIVYQMAIDVNPPTRPPVTTTPEPIPTGPPPNLRLPRNVVPEKYTIILRPHLYTTVTNVTNQTFLFSGNSTVIFRCLNKTKSIFLHSKTELNVRDPVLTRLDKEESLKVKLKVNDSTVSETDFLEVQLTDEDAALEPNGTYSLFTNFSGELLNDLAGFYSSAYELKETSEERYLAASQMQATDARKVFPCFDEPDMKAVFHLTILHRVGTKALSNWPKEDSTGYVVEIDGEKWIYTEFKPTDKMSTYLVAFAVSEFDKKSSPTHDRDITVWARPEAINAGHADYAANITPAILDFYQNEFNLRYPVSKLDQIALPDLAPTAMENWGLITYRESSLLYVQGVSSTFNLYDITIVIAHELAHQWFGNLVTMSWWNELWLNEGFATFMSYQGMKHAQPKWASEDLFVINEVQNAFQVDALASSHPLSSSEDEVQTVDQINELFDSVTYSKGAAVLRMLSYRVGEAKFKTGIRTYLKALQYGNADQSDLWTHMQQAYDEKGDEIKAFMSTWTNQAGFPVVTVDTNTGYMYQQKFLLNPLTNQSDPESVLNDVNFSDVSFSVLIVERSELKSDKWVLVNLNCVGYYRVNYNLENWERLITQLQTDHQAIPAINRGQLIDDAFNLARAGYLDVAMALNTTQYLINETQYIPWQSALNNLNFFLLMFDRSEVYGPMQVTVSMLVTSHFHPLWSQLGLLNLLVLPFLHRYAQLEAISMACRLGYKDCIEMAQDMFTQWTTNGTIHPNLQSNIYCHAIAAGGEEEWEFVWKAYLSSTIATERDKLRYGLSCTKHIWLLNRYLQYTLDATKIRKMDVVSTISSIAGNVAGQALAWDFIRAHWKHFSNEFGEEIGFLGHLIHWVTERFSTEYELQQLKQFQSDHTEESLGSASRAVEQAIERTQANILWVRENKDIVLDWFQSALETST